MGIIKLVLRARKIRRGSILVKGGLGRLIPGYHEGYYGKEKE